MKIQQNEVTIEEDTEATLQASEMVGDDSCPGPLELYKISAISENTNG